MRAYLAHGCQSSITCWPRGADLNSEPNIFFYLQSFIAKNFSLYHYVMMNRGQLRPVAELRSRKLMDELTVCDFVCTCTSSRTLFYITPVLEILESSIGFTQSIYFVTSPLELNLSPLYQNHQFTISFYKSSNPTLLLHLSEGPTIMAPSAIDVATAPTELTHEKPQHHAPPKVDSFDAKTATTEELAQALIHNGCFYLRNFIDQDSISQIIADVRPYFDQDPPWDPSGVCFPPQTKRVSGLAAKSDSYRNKVLMNPTWLSLSERVLATKTSAWFGDIQAESTSHPILGGTVCFQVKAGAAAQGLHRDNMGYHHNDARITADEWRVGRDSAIALFLAGTRTTKENGATRFVPRSHLQGSGEGPGNEEGAVYAEMEPGDCLVMFTSLYHAGSANLTESEERLVFTNFSIKGTLRGVSFFSFPPPTHTHCFPPPLLFLIFPELLTQKQKNYPFFFLKKNRWKINTYLYHLAKQHPGRMKSFPSWATPSPTPFSVWSTSWIR